MLDEFQYDIALSLCRQDVDFARNLVNHLNPTLKTFFYEHSQEELIGKSGPEEFAKIFKEKSRVVVILSRDEWSESYYTEIERNAIIDRTSVKNQGFGFLIVIPMLSRQIPSWYPSTRIYADPQRFAMDQLAKFIEFKVAEEGGVVKPITLEDSYSQLLFRIEEKKKLVRLQETREALDEAKKDVNHLKDVFNNKIQALIKNQFTYSSYFLFSGLVSHADFSMNGYKLNCRVSDPFHVRFVTTQDSLVEFRLTKQLEFEEREDQKIEKEVFIYCYSPTIKGWCQSIESQHTEYEVPVLFRNRDNSKHYDLTKPIASFDLVDSWFQKLLKLASADIAKYLK